MVAILDLSPEIEQKPAPEPVRITAQVSLSSPASRRASRSGVTVSKDMAFMRSGRLRVNWRTWGRGSDTSRKLVMGPDRSTAC